MEKLVHRKFSYFQWISLSLWWRSRKVLEQETFLQLEAHDTPWQINQSTKFKLTFPSYLLCIVLLRSRTIMFIWYIWGIVQRHMFALDLIDNPDLLIVLPFVRKRGWQLQLLQSLHFVRTFRKASWLNSKEFKLPRDIDR